MTAATGLTYQHDGVVIDFEDGIEVASDTTVIRDGTVVHATTDHLLSPEILALGEAVKKHLGAISGKGRSITYLDAYVEGMEGGTFYHWIVTYLGGPVRLPKHVVSFD